MVDILFSLIGGSAFFLLGRWMYRNPKSVYPNWLYSNPDHPLLLGGVRVVATMFIFMGSCAVLAGIVSHLVSESLTLTVIVLGAMLSGWLLRPLSKKGEWGFSIFLVVAVLSFFALPALMGNSEICQLAIKDAQLNPAVTQRLGTPVKQGLFVSGSIQISGPSGHANISIPVSGPRAKGTLYVVGAKSAGIWKIGTLQLAVKGDSNRIDLLDSSSSKDNRALTE